MKGLYSALAFELKHMKGALQEDLTGCGIAYGAIFVNVSYLQVASVAMTLSINVRDTRL